MKRGIWENPWFWFGVFATALTLGVGIYFTFLARIDLAFLVSEKNTVTETSAPIDLTRDYSYEEVETLLDSLEESKLVEDVTRGIFGNPQKGEVPTDKAIIFIFKAEVVDVFDGQRLLVIQKDGDSLVLNVSEETEVKVASVDSNLQVKLEKIEFNQIRPGDLINAEIDLIIGFGDQQPHFVVNYITVRGEGTTK